MRLYSTVVRKSRPIRPFAICYIIVGHRSSQWLGAQLLDGLDAQYAFAKGGPDVDSVRVNFKVTVSIAEYNS